MVKKRIISRKSYSYITYKKGGRVVRHKSLASATASAKGQARLGRRGFVDKDFGKFLRNIKTFEPKKKRKKTSMLGLIFRPTKAVFEELY